jgi:hypothetical protein
MGIGFSVFVIAVGAILRFAVTVHTNGFNVHTIGVILLVVGIVGLLASLIFWSSWGGWHGGGGYRRTRTVTQDGTSTSVEDRSVY